MSTPLPDNWASMVVTENHSNDILSYPIGWTWTGAPTAVVGIAAGTGKFGFLVYRNLADKQALSINKDSNFGGNIRYLVKITNPTSVSDYTLQRLQVELYCLSYATTPTYSQLPKVGDSFWTSVFGTVLSGTKHLVYPKVTNIRFDQVSEKDPSLWVLTYTLERERVSAASGLKPKPGDAPTKPNIEEQPWALGPEVQINFGTEEFVLGLGKFIGAKTPAELNTALENDTYPALFSDTSGSFEVVANSAGDPFENPPPMKVGNATISISRAFETMPSGLANAINAATEQVCNTDVTVNGVTFPEYSCKLNGATIANRRWKRTADWLPNQTHPFDSTYADVGWTPPSGVASTAIAVNYYKVTLPAFVYVEYFQVSISIAQRGVGWGYALVDKGFRKKGVDGKPKEIGDVGARQTYASLLAEGAEVDRSVNTSDQKVLRLYQVLKTGSDLGTVLSVMLTP